MPITPTLLRELSFCGPPSAAFTVTCRKEDSIREEDASRLIVRVIAASIGQTDRGTEGRESWRSLSIFRVRGIEIPEAQGHLGKFYLARIKNKVARKLTLSLSLSLVERRLDSVVPRGERIALSRPRDGDT